jgi:aminopeptidase N
VKSLSASVVFLLGTFGDRAAADTYPRQPGIDAVHYSFRLSLSDQSDVIEGEASLDVRFREDGVTALGLDLVEVRDGKGMSVNAAEWNGAPAVYAHQGDRLTVNLPSPSKTGERGRLAVRYRGVPASGLRIGPNRHGERTFFSDNWPNRARHWLPTIDHPSDKATSELIVTAPSHYQVISNGVLVEETDLPSAMRRTHWLRRRSL